MYPVSEAFLQAVQENTRRYYWTGRITTVKGAVYEFGPNEIVKGRDYFLWRQEDAHRNSLNSHCYWMLRKEGKSVQEATAMLEGQSVSYKYELLFSRGINFDKLPASGIIRFDN